MHTQCSPSRAALVTGRFMHSMGHRTSQHLVRAYESQLFRYLKDHAYAVNWFGINDVLSADSFNASVSTWEPLRSLMNTKHMLAAISRPEAAPFFVFAAPAGARPPTNGGATPAPGSGGGGSSGGTGAAGYPFGTAGYYSFYDGSASVNYDPAAIKRAAPLRPAVPDAAISKPQYHSKIPVFRNLSSLEGTDFFYKLNANYLDRVTATDALLGQILDAVDVGTEAAKTVVITSSDSGDFAGDYGLVEKWPGGVDDVLTRVPLIIRLPPSLRPAARHRHHQQPGHTGPVQTFDLMPTILELAGITITHTHFATSLVSVLTGAAQTDGSRFVFAEGGYLYPTEIEPLNSADDVPGPDGDPHDLMYPRGSEEMENCTANLADPNTASCHGSPRVVMIRNSTIKLAYRPNGRSELYDLGTDADEMHNLWEEHAYGPVKEELLGRLRTWFLETSDTTDEQLKTGRGAPAMPEPRPPLVPPHGARKPGDKRPNFVFYFPDETRAEALGTFGLSFTYCTFRL